MPAHTTACECLASRGGSVTHGMRTSEAVSSGVASDAIRNGQASCRIEQAGIDLA